MFPSSSGLLLRQAFNSRLLSSTLACRNFSNSNPQLNLSRLDNGLRVTSAEKSGELATLGLTLEAGISHQRKDNAAAQNLKTAFDAAHSSVSSLRFPGNFNSSVTRDRTVLTLTAPKSDLSNAVRHLAHLLSLVTEKKQGHELLPAGTLIDNANRSALDVVTDHLYGIAFQGSPMSFSPLGAEPFQVEDYHRFLSDNITAPRVLVSGVGVAHEELVQLVQTEFSKLSLQNSAGASPSIPRYVGAKADIRDDFLSKIHITYAVQAPARTSDSYLAARVIQAILGDWDISHGVSTNSTSFLAETIALEKLADKVSAFYDAFQTTGLLGVHTIAHPEEIEDFSVAVLTEFVRISQKVSEAEVDRAKRRVKAQILSSTSTSAGLLENISDQVFYHGRRTSIEETLTRLDRLSRTDVKTVAEEILYDVDPVISAFGPTTHLPDYNRLRSWIYWNRL